MNRNETQKSTRRGLRGAVAGLVLSAGLLSACGSGSDLGECPDYWTGPEVKELWKVHSVLSTIGEMAINDIIYDRNGKVDNDEVNRDTRSVFVDGIRNNAENTSQIFCEDDQSKVVVNPEGSRMIVVAREDPSLDHLTDSLDDYLPEQLKED
jgi:hypothetical protein